MRDIYEERRRCQLQSIIKGDSPLLTGTVGRFSFAGDELVQRQDLASAGEISTAFRRQSSCSTHLSLLVVYLCLHVHASHVGMVLKVIREGPVMGLNKEAKIVYADPSAGKLTAKKPRGRLCVAR